MGAIDTEKLSLLLREKAINIDGRSVLITNFNGSEQEKDLTEPANCNGFGRVRHFKLDTGNDWIQNPLPILPASKALSLLPGSQIKAQVFQNSICNWRCWYCFVDFKLLNGDSKYSSFLTCDDLLDLYLNESEFAPMIDLSGGQPDLTPEWVPWMMDAITARGLQDKIYLWSDDNLSNDYFWRYLTNEQIKTVSNYKLYSRVCCFKGIDEKSFSLNTKADPHLFNNQFLIFKRLLNIKIDLYCYVTLTANCDTNFEVVIPTFLDKLQNIHELLPLRTVPLKVFEFTPVKARMNDTFKDMVKGQQLALTMWNQELFKRFTVNQLQLPITEVQLYK